MVGQRKALAQPLQAVVERRDLVQHFACVVDRGARRLVQFKQEEVRQGGLRSFDSRGNHRFLSHLGANEERLVRQHRCNTVQAA